MKQRHFDQHARELVLPRTETASGRGVSYAIKQRANEDAGHMGHWAGAWLVFKGSAWVPLLHRTAMQQYEWCSAHHPEEREALRALLDMTAIFADRSYYEQLITDTCVVVHKPLPRALLRIARSEA